MAFVGAAISAVGGFLATAGGTAGFFSTIGGRLLASVALSALSRALAPKPKQAGVRTSSTLAGGTTPEGFLLGWYATEGQLVAPPMSHGKAGKTPNAYLTYVIEVGGIEGQTLDGLIIDGEPVTLGSTPHEDGYGLPVEGRFADRAWIKYYDGTQTAADPMLVAKYGDYERPWTADHIGTGLCYAVLTFRYDRKVFSGFPTVRFVMQGVPLYDPRLDSTAGGSGPHRWGNAATYAATVNPMVMIYNILRGISLPGGHVWGGEAAAADLPYARWAAAMDDCDEDHDGAARYRAGFEVLVEDEPYQVIEELLTACGGQLAEIGGEWVPSVGAPDLPVMWITDDDVIVTEADEFDPFPAPEETFNGATGSFPRPSAAWEASEVTPYHNTTFEAADGGRRLMAALQVNACPYPKQVRRLMREAVKDSRRWRVHSISLPPEAGALQPLDTISWTSARNGYDTKLFEVQAISRDPQGASVAVVLRERDPSDYDFAAETLPAAPSLLPVIPAAQAVPGWSVTGISVRDASDTARRPALQFGWDAEAADDATGLRWRVRRVGQTAIDLRGSTHDIEAGELVVAAGILPATAYEAQARYVFGARASDWSSWISVTTPAIRLGPADVDWSSLQSQLEQDILDSVADLTAWIEGDGNIAWVDDRLVALSGQIGEAVAQAEAQQAQQVADTRAAADRYRALVDQVEAIRDYAAQIDYRQWDTREELRRQVSLLSGANLASFDERINVALSETAALAERITTAEADVDGIEASLTLIDTARADGDTALAQQIAALAVGTATQFDHVGIWYFDGGIEGWTGNPAAPTAVSGYLRPATGSGAWVSSPAGLAVAAATYNQVRARLRRVGAPAWAGWLWWCATGQDWDTSRRIAITEPTWVDGIGLITVSPAWTGSVDRIRLDLASAPTVSAYIEIDWASIGRPAPGATSAQLAAETTARIAADSAQASDITALEASLTTLEDAQTATAGVVTALDGRVTDTEDGLDAVSTALTAVQADLAGKATAEAVAEIEAQVAEVTGGVTSETIAVTALRNTVLPLAEAAVEQGFADFLARSQVREAVASADQTLRTGIDLRGAEIAVVADRVATLEAALPGLASATAVETLTARVVVTEASITSISQSITALTADLAGKATVSAMDSLTARVTSAEGDITAVGDAQTALAAVVGGFSAGGRFRATVEATPSGALARIGLSVAASGGGATQTAALFMEAVSGGQSRVLIRADQFAVVDGASRHAPFIVSDGVVYLNEVRIRNAQIDGDMMVGGATMRSAFAEVSPVTPISISGAMTVIENFACAFKHPATSGVMSADELGDRPVSISIGLTYEAAAQAQLQVWVQGWVPGAGWYDLTPYRAYCAVWPGQTGQRITETVTMVTAGGGARADYYTYLRVRATVASAAPWSGAAITLHQMSISASQLANV